MTDRPTTPLPIPPASIPAIGLTASLLVGMLLGREPALGVALLIAVLYTPLVLLNLPLGIAIYVVLLFNRNLPVVSIGPTAASILILAGWLGSLRPAREWVRQVFRAYSRMLSCIALLIAWMALSALWAPHPGDVGIDIWLWASAAIAAVIVMTMFSSKRAIEILVIAFIVGGASSVLIGVVTGGLSSTAGAGTVTEGRFVGGAADPNYLASALVPAIMLAVGLTNVRRGLIERWALTVAIAVMALGLAATESRGGFLAAAVALLASVVFLRGRRGQALMWLSLAAMVAAVWFSASPAAWERITSLKDDGNGRSDLWHVAAEISGDHPFLGVGLNNYRAVAPDYTRDPGQLEFVRLIAEQPHFVHNVYLQLTAETGFVGLFLLLGIIVASLRAAHRAGWEFEARGDPAWAALSRSVLVGTLGMLTAFVFISNGFDQRLWMLLGLGPALLMVARQRNRAEAAPEPQRNGQPSPAAVLERVGAAAVPHDGNGGGAAVRAPR